MIDHVVDVTLDRLRSRDFLRAVREELVVPAFAALVHHCEGVDLRGNPCDIFEVVDYAYPYQAPKRQRRHYTDRHYNWHCWIDSIRGDLDYLYDAAGPSVEKKDGVYQACLFGIEDDSGTDYWTGQYEDNSYPFLMYAMEVPYDEWEGWLGRLMKRVHKQS